MDDYIRRGAAIVKVQKCDCIETQEAEDKLIEAIESIPPADVRPVVRGEWKRYEAPAYGYGCPFCGRWEPEQEPFCHCGADMRPESPGEEKDDG